MSALRVNSGTARQAGKAGRTAPLVPANICAADQIKIDISTLTTEPSPNVLAYGVAVINGSYPEPFPEPGPPNQLTAGVTRKAPFGVQKFT